MSRTERQARGLGDAGARSVGCASVALTCTVSSHGSSGAMVCSAMIGCSEQRRILGYNHAVNGFTTFDATCGDFLVLMCLSTALTLIGAIATPQPRV